MCLNFFSSNSQNNYLDFTPVNSKNYDDISSAYSAWHTINLDKEQLVTATGKIISHEQEDKYLKLDSPVTCYRTEFVGKRRISLYQLIKKISLKCLDCIFEKSLQPLNSLTINYIETFYFLETVYFGYLHTPFTDLKTRINELKSIEVDSSSSAYHSNYYFYDGKITLKKDSAPINIHLNKIQLHLIVSWIKEENKNKQPRDQIAMNITETFMRILEKPIANL